MLDWNLFFHIFSPVNDTKYLESAEKVFQSHTANCKLKQSACSKLDTNKVAWAVNLLPFN